MILPLGRIIVSYGWATYNRIEQIGFQNEVVIHEDHFVDPATRIHTNNVEITGNGANETLYLFMALIFT